MRSSQRSAWRELAGFVLTRHRLWLLPILILLLLTGMLAATGALTPYSIFLYPL